APPDSTYSPPPLKIVADTDLPPANTASTPPLETTPPLAKPPEETFWVPLIWAPKSVLPEEMVSTPPPKTTVEVAVPETTVLLPLMVPEPPTKNWPPELTVVAVIVAPST